MVSRLATGTEPYSNYKQCLLSTVQWSSYMNKVTCLKLIKYHLIKLYLLLRNGMSCVRGTLTTIHEFAPVQMESSFYYLQVPWKLECTMLQIHFIELIGQLMENCSNLPKFMTSKALRI